MSFRVQPAFALLSASVASLFLAGCAMSNTASTSSLGPASGNAIAGNVHGGQQPVAGARVYLLVANPAGYGTPSLSLLTSAATGHAVDSIGAYVTTNDSGQFDITGDYHCMTGYAQGASTTSGGVDLSGFEQVYLYVAGGNPGLGTGNNDNIGLMAALGPCEGQFSQTLQVNEITTVAAAYALAGFASDATHVSSSGSGLASVGLNNAGLTSQNLANVATGYPPVTTAGHNGIIPANTIVSIANILSACINGATGNSSCNTLFNYTRSNGATGVLPTDTASAAINLAHNPFPGNAGMTALFGLVTAQPAFGGGLTTQPNDFTLGLTFNGGGFNNGGASGLAIDDSGNVFSTSGPRLAKFSPTGVPYATGNGFTGGGLSGTKNIAIDTNGNVWAANLGFNTLSEFTNAGTPISPSGGYSGATGGISGPQGIAIDQLNSVWIANSNGTISKYSSAGLALSPPGGFTDNTSLVSFSGVAIDTAGNAWASNINNGDFSEFSTLGTQLTPKNGYYGNGLGSPYAVAIDAAGNLWEPDYYNSSVGAVTHAGAAISPVGGYRTGGLNTPESIAIDSAGRVWVGNFNGNTVSAFTNAGVALSPSTGYGLNSGSGLYGPVNIAIDGSGNVWVTNYNGSLTELVGAASPVVTPLAANLVFPYGSATVNLP